MSDSSMDRVLDEFLRSMEHCEPCGSMDDAHQLICRKLLEVGERNQLPPAVIKLIRCNQLNAQHGWNNVDGDPCYRDFGNGASLRVNLHRNGTIVIQALTPRVREVLLVKLGSDNAFHSSGMAPLQ